MSAVKERAKKHKELQKQVTKEKALAKKLVLLMSEAGELGLFRTMHKIKIPIKEVGWEIAERIKHGNQ